MKFHFFIVRDASPSLILSITLKMIILQRRREFWMEVLRLRILSRTNREDVFWNGDFRVHTLFMILLPYVFRKIYHSSDPPRPPPPHPPTSFFQRGGSKCWLPTRRGGILKIFKKRGGSMVEGRGLTLCIWRKIIFFCNHNFMKKGHSKLSKNEPANIP